MSKNKIKLLFYGDAPTCATGFGTVSRNILDGLHKTGKYDICVLGVNYWGDPHPYPYPIWPIGIGGNDPYGRQRAFDMMATGLDFDVLFLFQDSFILESFMGQGLPQLRSKKSFVTVGYYPIDGVPKKKWVECMNSFDVPVTYTEYGKTESILACPEIANKIKVIPHGANTKDFYPLPEAAREAFRKEYFGKHAGKFIVTNVNRNQQRKDIPRTLLAFKELKKRRPNSVLYLHCAAKDQGWDIPQVVEGMGLILNEDVLLPGNNFGPNLGYPIEILNSIYNASDVVISTTLGEGALRGDTLIYTDKGLVQIKDVKVGDKVFTHKGRYQEVDKTLKVQAPKEVYKLRSHKFHEPLHLTNDHPVLTERGFVRADELRGTDVVLFTRQTEVKDVEVIDLAEYLEGTSRFVVDDKFIICTAAGGKRVNRFIPLNEDVMWLLGLYLAEGSTGCGALSFSLHEDEVDIHSKVTRVINQYFNSLGEYASPQFTPSKKDKSGCISFHSSPVCSFFKSNCGANSHVKDIPQWAKKLPFYKLEALVGGMVDGDGDGPNFKSWQKFRYKTVSQKMAYSFRDCLLTLGELPAVALEDNSSGFGDGNIYTVTVLRRCKGESMNATTFKKKAHVEEGYVKMQLMSVERVDSYGGEDYYDLSVPGDNSYTTSTVTVHNCGLSSLEAMACKTPIVFPNNTALTEIVDMERGFLVKSGGSPNDYVVLPNDNEVVRPLTSVVDMASALIDIYDDNTEAKRRTEVAYKWIQENLVWNKHIVPQWDKLISEAVSEWVKRQGAAQSNVVSAEDL